MPQAPVGRGALVTGAGPPFWGCFGTTGAGAAGAAGAAAGAAAAGRGAAAPLPPPRRSSRPPPRPPRSRSPARPPPRPPPPPPRRSSRRSRRSPRPSLPRRPPPEEDCAGALSFFGFFSFTSHSGSTCWGSFHHSMMAAWMASSSPLRDFTSASRSFRLCSGQASRNWWDIYHIILCNAKASQRLIRKKCVVEVIGTSIHSFRDTENTIEKEMERTNTRVRHCDSWRLCAYDCMSVASTLRPIPSIPRAWLRSIRFLENDTK